jgi:hypothetical protein
MDAQKTVDADIVDLFHSVQLPSDVTELQKAVEKAGLDSKLRRQELVRAPPVDKRKAGRKRPRLGRLTNTHLPSIFAGQA